MNQSQDYDDMHTPAHTQIHTHIYIYIYVCVCVCVCLCVCVCTYTQKKGIELPVNLKPHSTPSHKKFPRHTLTHTEKKNNCQ